MPENWQSRHLTKNTPWNGRVSWEGGQLDSRFGKQTEESMESVAGGCVGAMVTTAKAVEFKHWESSKTQTYCFLILAEFWGYIECQCKYRWKVPESTG